MIKLLSKYSSLVAAVFVLAPLLFWFAYSEIGQFTVEKEHPATQDYCESVKVIKAEIGKTSVNDLLKLKENKSICLHCINEVNKLFTSFNKSEIGHFHTPQTTTNKVYLYNRAFLI